MIEYRTFTIIILFFLFLGIAPYLYSAQEVTPSQIERSREFLEKEKTLRDKIEKEEKVYIKKIMLKGATLLDPQQIKKIILPFQKHWLTKNDIQQLLGILKQAYIDNGYAAKLKEISYQVKKRILEIQVEEALKKH